jgi:peptide chain release factor
METKILQITSGKGPAECCLAVALVLKEIILEAKTLNLNYEMISRFAGDMNGTLTSATIKLQGKGAAEFITSWEGILLWVAQSPCRKFHKRKNWFIGIHEIKNVSVKKLSDHEIVFQTMRSSGPGGQNVNKTETAVRAIHKISGLSVSCDTYRSQLQNKQMAIERLKNKYELWQQLNIVEQEFKTPRENNNNLSRGNPVRIYKGENFLRQ